MFGISTLFVPIVLSDQSSIHAWDGAGTELVNRQIISIIIQSIYTVNIHNKPGVQAVKFSMVSLKLMGFLAPENSFTPMGS